MAPAYQRGGGAYTWGGGELVRETNKTFQNGQILCEKLELTYQCYYISVVRRCAGKLHCLSPVVAPAFPDAAFTAGAHSKCVRLAQLVRLLTANHNLLGSIPGLVES